MVRSDLVLAGRRLVDVTTPIRVNVDLDREGSETLKVPVATPSVLF